MHGKVLDLGYFGKDSLYRVQAAQRARSCASTASTTAAAGESERVAVWEDEVWLSFEPASAILLDGVARWRTWRAA